MDWGQGPSSLVGDGVRYGMCTECSVKSVHSLSMGMHSSTFAQCERWYSVQNCSTRVLWLICVHNVCSYCSFYVCHAFNFKFVSTVHFHFVFALFVSDVLMHVQLCVSICGVFSAIFLFSLWTQTSWCTHFAKTVILSLLPSPIIALPVAALLCHHQTPELQTICICTPIHSRPDSGLSLCHLWVRQKCR